MCQPVIYTLEGDKRMFAFQVCGVSKPLCAVSRIVGSFNDVVFRHPSRGGSYIMNVNTGKKTPLRQQHGVYYLDVWVKPGEYVDAKGNPQGFHRQAS